MPYAAFWSRKAIRTRYVRPSLRRSSLTVRDPDMSQATPIARPADRSARSADLCSINQCGCARGVGAAKACCASTTPNEKLAFADDRIALECFRIKCERFSDKKHDKTTS